MGKKTTKTVSLPGEKKEPFLKRRIKIFKKNWQLLLLCLPALTGYILFSYVPMTGLVMAFKNYRYKDGIFGSPWAGFKNFEFLFKSVDIVRITRNTVGYALWFLVIDMVVNVIIALLLFEINSKKALKLYQTVMTIPRFLSIVIISFITYAVLSPTMGIMNQVLNALGQPSVDVYTNPAYWPFILTVVHLWQSVGMGCIMYYANLLGIDPSLYEAARIDGASRWQQTIHISIPSLIPLMTIMGILAMGGIFGSDFGLFYQIPRNVGVLYPTTDTIDTYVYRGLKAADFGMSSATGFVQSVVGLVMVTLTNAVVKKISPENSMF